MTNTTSKISRPQIVKHRDVADALRTEVEAGHWVIGERLPGEQDLARRFQVAHMTMRQAVANLVDEGILIRVRGKGTYIVPKEERSEEITALPQMALLFPSNSQKRDPYYFPEVLEGFMSALHGHGQSASVYPSDIADPERLLEPGTAVAFMLLENKQVQYIERLRDSGLHVLAINRYTGRRSIPCVRIDDAGGVASAVEHLVSLGHEKIGFAMGLHDNNDAADRLRGFRGAVKHHGVKYAPEGGDAFSEVSGYAAAHSMLTDQKRPTAIICASDLCALGVIKAAHDLGLSVPRDVSVIGFGDFSVADYMLPRLTTIRQSRVALGRIAAEALIDLAAGRHVANTVLPADLIVRDSTAIVSQKS